MLDSDGSGTIERREFVNWWLHGSTDGVGKKKKKGGAGSKLGMVASAGKASLLDARYLRQQAQNDARLLRNRIQLLQHEEMKARKKIEATETRAQEMLRLKKETMKRLEEKAAVRQIKKKEELGLKSMVEESKKDRESSRYVRANQIADRKRADVEAVREARRRAKAERERQAAEELARARAKHDEILKSSKAPAKVRKKREKKLHADVRAEYERKIAAEEEACRQREIDVRRMEKEELVMIERLRKVQALQREAFAELEEALSGGT